jgi:hypothetical protein
MVIIDGYPIDAALSEEHSFDNEVTAHPVERGADVTDHVRARPIVVSIEGLVSDTPIGAIAGLRAPDVLPSDDAFARLRDLRDRREPVTIETSLQVFRNMVLQSLSVPRDARNGDALRFRATFQQVRLVVTERTVVDVAVPRAAKKVNRGTKPAPETPLDDVPPKEKGTASVLESLLTGKRAALADDLGF